ncbi:MAG: SUMF1/EgtB/PvdO family nonheme iron enzyme [Deltaproteobacteria bacterium]|nr:SUMF1/EgtB/PvdO family nonheme iron enzyme [Deltaproteobacteria bacterium]
MANVNATCPAGTVLIERGGKVHPDEPSFCLEITEVTRAAERAYWGKRQKSEFKGIVKWALWKEDNKPANLRTWHEARQYCAAKYQGGDLPTNKQWEKACGDKKYCTASGELKPSEADIGSDTERGPAEVTAFPPNSQGVKNMTGGVAEWIRDSSMYGKYIRGGSWDDNTEWSFSSLTEGDPDESYLTVGFRCVAQPISKK